MNVVNIKRWNMGNVVQVPQSLIHAPFGPRENTPELRAALRKASIKDVRDRVADHSGASAKTWALIGKELLGEKKRAEADGARVFASLFAVTSAERKDASRYPFSLKTAYKLMAIAESDFRTVCESGERLPSSWGTLHYLSRIPASSLIRFIESGAVHPMMTRAEASKLAGNKPAKQKLATTGYGAVKQHFLAIKTPDERAAVFLKLMRDCHITLEQLQGAE